MFGRAVRAQQLYLPNNPTFLRALENARASFAPIWQHADELVIEVGPGEREEANALVVAAMTGVKELRVPLEVSVGIGADWDSAAH